MEGLFIFAIVLIIFLGVPVILLHCWDRLVNSRERRNELAFHNREKKKRLENWERASIWAQDLADKNYIKPLCKGLFDLTVGHFSECKRKLCAEHLLRHSTTDNSVVLEILEELKGKAVGLIPHAVGSLLADINDSRALPIVEQMYLQCDRTSSLSYSQSYKKYLQRHRGFVKEPPTKQEVCAHTWFCDSDSEQRYYQSDEDWYRHEECRKCGLQWDSGRQRDFPFGKLQQPEYGTNLRITDRVHKLILIFYEKSAEWPTCWEELVSGTLSESDVEHVFEKINLREAGLVLEIFNETSLGIEYRLDVSKVSTYSNQSIRIDK